MLKRKKTRILFYAQWWSSLLLYIIFSHSVSALTVDFSITPSSSGPAPLFVTLSVNNNASLSPGFSISGYQWEITGPETIQVPGRTGVTVELKKVGEYSITLTMTEYDPNTSPRVTNMGTKTKTVTVLRAGSEPITQSPAQTQTPTSTQQTPSTNQPSDFTNPFTQTPITQTPTTQTPTTTIPEPSFTASPSSGQAPLPVTLSVNNPSNTLAYSWQANFLSGPTTAPVIPDGSSSQVTLTQAGNYSVTVTARDSQGNSSDSDPEIITVLSSSVVIPNQNQNQTTTTPPIANFTATPTFGNAPLTVTLNGSSSTSSSGTTINSYQWQSSDRQTITNTQRTSITYTQPGTYTIGLTVRDSLGLSSTITTQTITVTQAQVSAPQASFTVTPTSGNAPLTVTLDGSGSTSPSGTITGYQWQSGEGQVENDQITSITYNQPGTYTISLTVTDSAGLTDTTTQTIVVNEIQVPTASFTATPTSGDAPLTVTLDGSESTSSSGNEITDYQWQSSEGQVKNGQNTSITYTQAGTYTISLIVTDSAGLSSTSTSQTIVVNEAPVPKVSFTATPTSGIMPLTVNLDASNSTGNGITYQWTRNDGIAINENSSTVSTTFENGGTYTVTLTITDQSGKQDQDDRTLTIVPKLEPRFTVATNSALLDTYTLDASNSTVSSNTTYTWNIDEQPQGNESVLTKKLEEGTHQLELILSDNFGQSESLAHYIYVPRTQLNPIPRFTMTQQGDGMLSLDASRSFDPDGGSIASYQWRVGGADWSTERTFLYQPTASTDITLIVTDGDEGTASESVSARITVDNGNIILNPVANFQTYDVKVENNKILSTMAFDISGSFHPDAEKNESLQPPEWFIGANENNCTPAADQDALEVEVDETDSVIHNIRFTKGGNYFLCLKVTDEDGREDTKGMIIKMANSYADDAPSFIGNQGGQPIKGGVLIKNDFLPKSSSAISNNTFVDIVAELTTTGGFPDNGGSIDVYVMVVLGNQYYMMDAERGNDFRLLENVQFESLVPAYKNIPFSNGKIHVPIFSGKMKDFIPAGTYQVFVGYDWSELPLDLNRAVYNPTDPIIFTVVDDSP
jgi:PKD repeat protein